MFVSQQKKTITYGSFSIVIRKLSGNSLQKCAQARQMVLAKIYGADLFKPAPKAEGAAEAEVEEKDPVAAARARHASFDRPATLVAGIDSWSAEEKLPAGIDQLEEEAAAFIFHEILDFSLPPLKAAAEAEGKGD